MSPAVVGGTSLFMRLANLTAYNGFPLGCCPKAQGHWFVSDNTDFPFYAGSRFVSTSYVEDNFAAFVKGFFKDFVKTLVTAHGIHYPKFLEVRFKLRFHAGK